MSLLSKSQAPRIAGVAHALPEHRIAQQDVQAAVADLMKASPAETEELQRIFTNSRIVGRQFMMPPDWYVSQRTPAERTRIYQTAGLALAEEAARACLESCACPAAEIDHIVFVSTTGLATPSLDAHLIERLGMQPSTSRLPIWGLGCAGGAAGLNRAADYARAFPRRRVLLVALECCSLTFLLGDQSKKNLIATALFSDGAAAALISGAQSGDPGVYLLAERSWLFPETNRIMGWDFVDEGMELVLSPRLPALVRQSAAQLVADFMELAGLQTAEISHHITHPGGAKVLDAYQQALGLAPAALELPEEVLREHGNLSSVSVLLVLEKWLKRRARQSPGYGLLSAFGPGFSSEMVLVNST